MEQNKNFDLLQTQIQTNVGFTSFMTAVVVFFDGLLITSFNSYDVSIRIPITFLIISVFGFLYATIISTNAAGEVTIKQWSLAQRYMLIGDAISEYIGVYFLVISIPLVINIITTDIFLRTVTIASCLGGLAVYQLYGVSLVGRHFPKGNRFLSFIILFLAGGIFLSQLLHFYFAFIALIFICLMIFIAFLAVKRGKSIYYL